MTDRPSYPGLPRWVKVSGIILIVLILLVAIIFAFDIGGEHGPEQFGPGQHGPSNDTGGETMLVGKIAFKEEAVKRDGL